MTEQEIEIIARDIISNIWATWVDTPICQKIETEGRLMFKYPVCTQTGNGGGGSVFYYDPLDGAVEIVGEETQQTRTVVYELRDYATFIFARRKIESLIVNAGTHIEHAARQLPRIASVLTELETLQLNGPHDKQKKIIDSTAREFDEDFRGRISPTWLKAKGAHPKLTPHAVFLTIVGANGKISQNELAKRLDVTAKTVRDWRKSLGYDTHEGFLKGFHKGYVKFSPHFLPREK